MSVPARDFSIIISGREVPLIMGTVNGVFSVDGKVSVLLVDEHDWFLRVYLSYDTLTSTLVNFQRQFSIIEASVLLANIRVDQRIEKSRLTIAGTYEKSTIHLRTGDFSKSSTRDFATAWRYTAEYEGCKTQADTCRYTILPLGEGRVTDDPGGNVRFEVEGGTHLTCYMSRTLTKAEILSKRMSTVLVTHTRLSRRTPGFHTTHASCMLPIDAAPEQWRKLYNEEASAHTPSSTTLDLTELLAGGGWMSSPDQGTPPLRKLASLSVPSALSTPTPRKELLPKQQPVLLDLGGLEDEVPLDFHQYVISSAKNGHVDALPELAAPSAKPCLVVSKHAPMHEIPQIHNETECATTGEDHHEPRRSPVPNPEGAKHKAVLSDGKVQVTDEGIDYLRAMPQVWFRDGPRGRKWIPAAKVLSGGDVKLVIQLPDGSTKHVERRRVAYSDQDP